MRRLAEEVIPEPGLHLEVGLLPAVSVEVELALEAGLAPPHVLVRRSVLAPPSPDSPGDTGSWRWGRTPC